MDCSLLVSAPLFSGYGEKEIEKILSGINHRLRRFRSGSLIAMNGEKVNSLRLVISGITKGEMVDFSGRIIKIEEIPAPGALAAAFIFGKKNNFPVNVIAMTDVEILIIEKEEFLKLLIRHERILVNFLEMISTRSQFLSEKIKFLSFKTIKGKLAQYFLQRTGNKSSSFVLDVTQNDLADYFGVARPSIARALGEMEKDGIITARGRYITIKDGEKLSMLTAE
ncbi:MAG TPA: Crp/Fnr family transcriptional regulator [Bacteroidales bacterium]|jgi:CRP-like cAMP-binding protein|nr:helix-turn-helix domain-containing protein [Bacteroidales bacterium]OQB59835.1 MAG: cAMP-activated global transcriptional regulator CRP [Bacteroidetes bacterium ADurb.Bin145]NMD03279.1 Crp/Fnr family transcriptional regulator [Bacteroidales bacterium]HOU02721.1 Crp/Fnr family transcriptional regulator [Bacteroidales bacterium]HQG62543.1 Crp/Fnr family transcriptional regulator [Bacteroidales bacterium]